MGEVSVASFRSLSVHSNPGYAVKIALDRLHSAITRTEKALAPSFLKKLLGGTSKDHARSVVASSMEDALAVRSVIAAAKEAARASGSGSGRALFGSTDRLIKAMDHWRDAALEFEEAIHGSDEILLLRSRKLLTLCHDLKAPASGIAE